MFQFDDVIMAGDSQDNSVSPIQYHLGSVQSMVLWCRQYVTD